jgi:multiple sugar transport system substrate-binding protein
VRGVIFIVWTLILLAGCQRPPPERVRITYWEKWSGFEAEAMEKVVDAFNRSQYKITVEYLSVSNVDRKTLVATAGGDPPDVGGVWLYNVFSFADRNALTPLDDFIRAEGYTVEQWLDRYAPIYASMCQYRGRVWALPSTPSTTALHWNKTLFREAGLDPDRPPRTVEELDAMSDKLVKRDPKTGEIIQLGFLPQEPGWFAWAFPKWFGGDYIVNDEIVIGKLPANLEAYRWTEGYTRRYGLEAIKSFTAGFGNFASPQNAFMAGKVAMVFQGVWLNNYLKQFAPGMDYGVAPFPATKPGLENFTVADSDILVIPRGAKHPREAWEFIKFVSSINPQASRFEELTGMELLCYLQQKNSPLRQWSPFFEKQHPHPHIALFRQLAESPNATHIPKIGIWQEYGRELANVFEAARLQTEPVEEALAFCQQRVSQSWNWHRRGLARREALAKADP